MPPNSARSGPEVASPDGAEQIRTALERDANRLLRSIVVKVRKSGRHLRRDEVEDRANEVLDETVCRALVLSTRLDPARPAYAWLVGISVNILKEQGRRVAAERRLVVGTDLGDGAWEALLGKLEREPLDVTLGDRIDVHEALGRLDIASRHAFECRFFRGLDGEELAKALGVPSVGAARVRVCRALQQLRKQYGVEGPEVNR